MVEDFKATKSDAVFTEIVNIVRPIVLGVLREVVTHKQRAFSIDTFEIESIISFESLLKAIDSYEAGKGNFNNWYYGVAKLDTNNIIRKQGSKKHSPTNGYLSLYLELDGEEGGFMGDLIEDKSSDVELNIERELKSNLLNVILAEFKKEYPREYEVVVATFTHSNDKEAKKEAYLSIYVDVTESYGTVRTRVSRAKDLFSKFLNERGFAV
jgi:DNA-directed RNA polymerase specialized sigma24 family protein